MKRARSLCVFFCIIAISGCHREDSKTSSAPTSRAFGYVANGITPGRVSEFAIDSATGVWTQISGSPFVEGASEPHSIAAAPSNKFLYVVNRGDSDVSVLSIDSATGSIAAVGAPMLTGDEHERLSFARAAEPEVAQIRARGGVANPLRAARIQ